MPKISRPILYVALVGVVVATYLFVSEPDAPAKKANKKTKVTATARDGVTVEDLNAKFDRYADKGKDSFFPKVIPAKSSLGETAKRAGGLDNWNLTGVSIVNNVMSATLENTQTKELQFLKTGDVWNSLKVILVASDHVMFRNDKNQETRLTFIDPNVDKTQAGNLSNKAGVQTAAVLVANPNSPNTRNARGVATNPQTAPERGTTQP